MVRVSGSGDELDAYLMIVTRHADISEATFFRPRAYCTSTYLEARSLGWSFRRFCPVVRSLTKYKSNSNS